MNAELTRKISSMGDRYGNTLIDLMDCCNACNLQQVTDEQAIDWLVRHGQEKFVAQYTKGSVEDVQYMPSF